jgi:3-methyladenine DNA glycosylase AlkD
MAFTSADYKNILEEFRALSDREYIKFHEGLVPGTQSTKTSYGVRMPQLRRIAKQVIKDDPLGFLAVAQNDSYTEIGLKALVISGMKIPLSEKLPLIEDYVPLIDNWASCDIFSIKAKPDELPLFWEFLQPYFASDKEFYIRFAVVIGMENFIVPEYIDVYLDRLSSISHDGYYVKMGVAWAVCECFVKFRDKTMPIFESKILDKQTQNKAIQKCRESFRVSDEDKEYLKTLKI